jgi:acyl carrier protein
MQPTLVTTPESTTTLEGLSKALFQVVAEKTGYPVDMLEPGMDMEADLGIDSIKRVEILGAMQALFPQLPKIGTDALGELRTLNQIVEQLGASVPAATQPTVSSPVTAAPVTQPESAAPVTSSKPSNSIADLTKALLAIVSEKTGYPADMIETGMDMEADLGIDSIKRVEILGAMQAQFPNLAMPGNQELVELHTLGQIVERMAPTESASAQPNPTTAVQVPLPTALVETASPGIGASVESLTKALLSVVSEKTGYPSDMLEMGMDMEADLGIDSIKRVEILGAMQALFPDLPPASSAALAETRTLGQIVEMLNQPALTETRLSGKEVGLSPSPFDVDLPRSRVRIKPLPRPDAIALQVAPGSVCLLTDDGTAVTPYLAQALSSQGWKVVVLSYPEHLVDCKSELPQDVQRVQLKEASELSMKLLLEEVGNNFGQVGMFIHLNPCIPTTPGTLFSEAGKELSRQVFLAAKHLKEPLNRAVAHGRAAFVTVARLDGAFGLEGNACSDPSAGGLFGLVKSLNLEWDPVFCRAIDLSPDLSPEQSVASILAELSDPNRLIAEVAYNPRGRFTLVIDSEENIKEE